MQRYKQQHEGVTVPIPIEIYVSTNVESDGPIPGPHSMVSFASAAFTAGKTLVSTFSANLQPLDGASGHPHTMEWWHLHSAAWAACQVDRKPPAAVMKEYLHWLHGLPGKPVFVGYPASFDFMFIYWYLMYFTGESPFTHSAVDIKSYAMATLKRSYFDSGSKDMPKEWLDGLTRSHIALTDAIAQGELFCNMLAANSLLLEESSQP